MPGGHGAAAVWAVRAWRQRHWGSHTGSRVDYFRAEVASYSAACQRHWAAGQGRPRSVLGARRPARRGGSGVIVTVTLNPVLHVDYAADKITPGASNPVRRVRYRAGGRGLAVARVLNTFGHDVVAAGLIGGSAGELIRNELARAGVPAQFTSITAESRRMVTVSDESDGVATSFAEPAPYITTEELGRLASDYLGLLADATAVVLCGSLPEGLPPEIYGSFVSYAAGAGVPVILDAGGSALAHGAA